MNTTQKTIQLFFNKKFFNARLCNIRATVREGTGYPSNRPHRDVTTSR